MHIRVSPVETLKSFTLHIYSSREKDIKQSTKKNKSGHLQASVSHGEGLKNLGT